MRNSMEQNTAYQTANMILTHFLAVLTAFLFGTIAFWWFLGEPVWKEIFSVIFVGVYSAMLYFRAKKFGNLDAKPYTPMKPRMYKGFLFGVFIALTVVLVYVCMRLVWTYQESNMLMMLGGNFLFTFWTFPYYGILGLNHGYIMEYAFVIMLILPVAVCGTGYIMGCKNKNLISSDFTKLMYEKQEKDTANTDNGAKR